MSEVVSQNGVEQAVVEALAAAVQLEPAQIDVDVPLMAVPGIDSVLLLAALMDIEDRCGVAVPDDVLFRANNTRELIELIGELKADA